MRHICLYTFLDVNARRWQQTNSILKKTNQLYFFVKKKYFDKKFHHYFHHNNYHGHDGGCHLFAAHMARFLQGHHASSICIHVDRTRGIVVMRMMLVTLMMAIMMMLMMMMERESIDSPALPFVSIEGLSHTQVLPPGNCHHRGFWTF